MKNEELFSFMCSFGLFIKGKESLNNKKKAPQCEHSGASKHFLGFHFYLSKTFLVFPSE